MRVRGRGAAPRRHNLLIDPQACEAKGTTEAGDEGAEIAIAFRSLDLAVVPHEGGAHLCTAHGEHNPQAKQRLQIPVVAACSVCIDARVKWFHSTAIFYSFFGNLAGASDLNPLAKTGAQS